MQYFLSSSASGRRGLYTGEYISSLKGASVAKSLAPRTTTPSFEWLTMPTAT